MHQWETYIKQVSPKKQDAAALFVPPSKFAGFLEHWDSQKMLPSAAYDRLMAKWLAWSHDDHSIPADDEPMAAIREQLDLFKTYHTRLNRHRFSFYVPGGNTFDTSVELEYGLISLQNGHKMWCGLELYYKHLEGLAPYVDDAVIHIHDECGYPDNNQFIHFRSGTFERKPAPVHRPEAGA